MIKSESGSPANPIGSRALEQEAKRVFRRLIEANSYLAKLGGHLERNEEYGVFVSRNQHKKPIMKVKPLVLAGFAAKDWVNKFCQDRWQITAQGEAWLRRTMAINDPFRTQHQLVSTKKFAGDQNEINRLAINLAESPLGWLRHRKGVDGNPLLNQEQYDAGERLRTDFEKAQMSPRITSDISMPLGSSTSRRAVNPSQGVALREAVIAAKERFFRALDAVGPDLSDVLIEVCCYLSGMEEAEKQLRLPQRSGKIVLQIALTRLGVHYGMIVLDTPHRYKAGAIRHWGKEDFRPKM